MSAFSIVHDISIELQSQIADALRNAPDVNFDIGPGVEKISLISPGGKPPTDTVASLYLYHVDIDKHLRNQKPLPDPANDRQFRRPPLPLQLRYLFTPIGEDEPTNQLVLGRVLQHFHDQAGVHDAGRTTGRFQFRRRIARDPYQARHVVA